MLIGGTQVVGDAYLNSGTGATLQMQCPIPAAVSMYTDRSDFVFEGGGRVDKHRIWAAAVFGRSKSEIRP